MIARVTRYTGTREAVEEAVHELVTLEEDQSYRTLLLHRRGDAGDTLLVLWFGEEAEEGRSDLETGLERITEETFDVLSPEEQRRMLSDACETLLRALGERRSPETEEIYGELEALSARLNRLSSNEPA